MKITLPFLSCHHAVPSSHTEADVAPRRLHLWTRPEGSQREGDVAFSGSEWLWEIEALALFLSLTLLLQEEGTRIVSVIHANT